MMLLTLLKILLFFAVVLAIALGANYWSAHGEGVRIIFDGSEYLLGPVQAVVALLVLAVLVWLAFKILGVVWAFLRFVMGDETAINRHFARSRERKGYEALSQGMLAVASGEGKLAQSQATKAAKYLDKPMVTNLLAAQAAEVAGDTATADLVYRKLLENDETRFVGVRGLMRQRLAQGDTHAALLLAEKAYALKPRHEDVQNTLLKLQTDQGDWKGARSVLKDKRRHGALPKDVHIRRDAVLALQEAKDVLAKGNSVSAREAAISANRASPDLIPAAALAARSYIMQKEPKNAARVLEKTWSVRPHPDIAAAYAEIAPDETPAERLRRFEALMRKNPDHDETKLLRAELLLANEDFPGARRALGDLAERHPNVRSLSIMAAIERGAGSDDATVRAWLVRALNASRGPQWVCESCANVMSDWSPVCDHCGGFDTLAWKEPDESHLASAAPNGVSLLPLIVGQPQSSEPHVTAVLPPAKPLDPGMTDMVMAPGEKHKKAPKVEIAHVAPGMVPRENDYVNIPPSATVTAAEDDTGRRTHPIIDDDADFDDTPPRRVPPDVEPLPEKSEKDR